MVSSFQTHHYGVCGGDASFLHCQSQKVLYMFGLPALVHGLKTGALTEGWIHMKKCAQEVSLTLSQPSCPCKGLSIEKLIGPIRKNN